MSEKKPIVLENDIFRLVLSPCGEAESLILKSNGEECLRIEEKLPFFSLTEERPYNNEIKLAYPTKRTEFEASGVVFEDGKLIVDFEPIDFKAVVDVKIEPRYMLFTLVDFIVKPDSFGVGVLPITPPVSRFRAVRLAVAARARFGEWLNVEWDDKVAVNVLAGCPYASISADRRKNYDILYGETSSEVKLKNASVGLIVSAPDELLDAIDVFESDLNLPRGVKSRRSPFINNSYYWVSDLTPENVDEHIDCALKGGFKLMSVYYSSIFNEAGGYYNNGQYDDYRKEYPNGRADLAAMLDKIKAAGIIPGLHILHTHVGLKTKYLTPVADYRVNLVRRFTLAKTLGACDKEIFVEEDPSGMPVFEKLRVLRFGGELIGYEGYTTEPPYRFFGCERGFNGTRSVLHEAGTCGGVLDISEFGGTSAHIDQRTGLQDEVADAIAEVYDAGFEFLYFDGAEGVNPPFDVNVGLAQWRVYKKLKKAPVFCESAAKSHFSWHMISGGNAFDIWEPELFKQMTVKHPFAEAARMKDDFTRINFGWWAYEEGQRADIFEYGTALAASCDCPGAFMASKAFKNAPRADDILEVFRRWEVARSSGFITPEIKTQLKKTDVEHTLLLNEKGQFELVEWERVKTCSDAVTAFVFERANRSCAVIWHNLGGGTLDIFLDEKDVCYTASIGGNEIPVLRDGEILKLPIAEKRYISAGVSTERLKKVLADSVLE